MKRSKSVKLIVLGSMATLSGCGPGEQVDVKQLHYASREDCEKDWGPGPHCAPDTTSFSGGHYGYVGPRYYWDPYYSRPVIVSHTGETHLATTSRVTSTGSATGRSVSHGTISRGGFGGSAHGGAHGSSGGS